jgi:hypothetical protein
MSYYGADQPGEAWQGGGAPGYGTPDPYGSAGEQWAPVPRQGSKGLVAVLATVLVIVLCGGGVAALYLIGAGTSTSSANGSSPTPGGGQGSGTAASTASYDPTGIQVNQCVQNEGTDDDPKLKVVDCKTPGSLKVIKRFDGTIDYALCNDVKGATHHYFYDTTPNSNDFVLCLQQQ